MVMVLLGQGKHRARALSPNNHPTPLPPHPAPLRANPSVRNGLGQLASVLPYLVCTVILGSDCGPKRPEWQWRPPHLYIGQCIFSMCLWTVRITAGKTREAQMRARQKLCESGVWNQSESSQSARESVSHSVSRSDEATTTMATESK